MYFASDAVGFVRIEDHQKTACVVQCFTEIHPRAVNNGVNGCSILQGHIHGTQIMAHMGVVFFGGTSMECKKCRIWM